MVFLIFLGIVLLVVAGGIFSSTRRSKGATRRAGQGGALPIGIVGVIFILLGLSLVSVGPNERVVVFNRVTGNLGDPKGPGLVFVNPLTTTYRKYDISRQTYTMSAAYNEGEVVGDDSVTARTSGGQEVFVDVTVIYSINPDRLNDVHIRWPDDRYRDELVRPLLRSVVRDAVSEFSIENVYQERQTIDQTITAAVTTALEAEGFILEDILVRNVTFTDEYAKAIESAQIAEVQIREQDFRIQEAQKRAQQTEEIARGEAEARRIQANADADALKAVAEVLEQNPILIQYEYVRNLSDNVQIIGLPSTSPFLFDFQSLQNLTPPTETPTETPSSDVFGQ